MVEPEERPAASASFQDDLAYLVLFSERLLDLVPDAVAVLDDRLRVRAANRAFAELLGHGEREDVLGRELAGAALLEATAPDVIAGSLQDRLRDVAESGGEISLERIPLPAPDGTAVPRAVRAVAWDTEDPAFRRLLLWIGPPERAEEAPAPSSSLLEEKDERIFQLTARAERFLERLTPGVCILDSALHVRAMNRTLEEAFDRSFRPEGPGDRHLFAVVPELRDEEFLARLERCRDLAEPFRGMLSVAGTREVPLEIDVEVQPVAGPDRHVGELLVLFHEVRGMTRASDFPVATAGAIPCGPEEILSARNLERWSEPATRQLLIVEKDSWTRMLVSDALRQRGLEDLSFVESGADALARHELRSFGAALVGLDADPEDARAFCRQVTAELPGLPVLGVTQREPESVREFLGSLPIAGILGTGSPGGIGETVSGLLRLERGETKPAAGPAPEAASRVCEIILLGASDADVAVLRLLYRVQRILIRLVYDPDPSAFGLAIARDLGIPTVSGSLRLTMEGPPDAAVIARPELAQHLADLGLEGVPRIERDEVEQFLVDPGAFLSRDSAAGSPLPAPEEPPPADDSVPPSTLGALGVQTVPVRRDPGEGDDAVGAPVDGNPDAEFGSVLGALDLLLDVDRLAERVLAMACDATGAVSGSLMVVRRDGRELRIAASRGLSELVVRNARQRVGEGVAGRVAESGEPLLLVGPAKGQSHERACDRPDVRSSVSVPLVTEGRVVGVFNLNSDPLREPFGVETLRRMERFGQRIGRALDSALALRQLRERSFGNSVRREIESIVAASEESDARLARCAELLAQRFDADACAIWVLDSKRGQLVLRGVAGMSAAIRDELSVPIGRGLVGWVARTLRPIALQGEGREDEGASDARVVVAAVPIRYRTDLVGVLAMEATSGVPFGEERLEILATVASVLGQEVGGLRAHQDSERKVTMLSALGELGLAFGAVPEPTGLARLVTFSACTLLGSDVATMRMLVAGAPLDSRRLGDYELLGAHGASVSGEGDPLVELEACIAREVVATGLPRREFELPSDEAGPLLERSSVGAALGVPLVSDGEELLGILVVYRVVAPDGASSGFREEEVEIAARLADYAAASVQRFVSERTSGREGEAE